MRKFAVGGAFMLAALFGLSGADAAIHLQLERVRETAEAGRAASGEDLTLVLQHLIERVEALESRMDAPSGPGFGGVGAMAVVQAP